MGDNNTPVKAKIPSYKFFSSPEPTKLSTMHPWVEGTIGFTNKD